MSDDDDAAFKLVEQMAAGGWSKWLELNKVKHFKSSGPTPGAIRLLMKAEQDPSFWPELIKRAENGEYRDRDAESALSYEAWTLIKRGIPFPAPLSTYVENILLEKIAGCNRRQGGPGRNAMRDAFIIQADQQLKSIGVKQEQKRHSIIARVLRGRGYRLTGRGAVETACKRFYCDNVPAHSSRKKLVKVQRRRTH